MNTVFIALRSKLARAVSQIVPPREIEDIVQETYVRVCQVENQGDIHHPQSFMLKTARNLALDYIKRAESRLVVSMDEHLESELPGLRTSDDDTCDRAAANQEFGHFCEAVRQLPLQCRKAFVLRKVYGYSQKEIALSLEISESTVEKHIATGIKRCAHYMKALANTTRAQAGPAPAKEEMRNE